MYLVYACLSMGVAWTAYDDRWLYQNVKAKREADVTFSRGRENVIRYECGQVKAELRPDAEGNLKIKYKIILEDKYNGCKITK